MPHLWQQPLGIGPSWVRVRREGDVVPAHHLRTTDRRAVQQREVGCGLALHGVGLSQHPSCLGERYLPPLSGSGDARTYFLLRRPARVIPCENWAVDPNLVGQALAAIWIVVSLWMGAVNSFMLFPLLAGIGQQGERPLSIRDEMGIVLFFLISATVAATWAFDSPENIPRNVGSMLLALALCVLAAITVRFRPGYDRS